MDLRIGHGIDIHPFETARLCVLGGVRIPCERGLAGHSDADALVHALIDAILGAIGERDIGTLFPDTDPALAGADSCVLLSSVWRTATNRGWKLVNADMTVLAEVPRLKPHVEEMRARLAPILDSSVDRITIKATTTERMGFIGRTEGLLASAVVLLQRPA